MDETEIEPRDFFLLIVFISLQNNWQKLRTLQKVLSVSKSVHEIMAELLVFSNQ